MKKVQKLLMTLMSVVMLGMSAIGVTGCNFSQRDGDSNSEPISDEISSEEEILSEEEFSSEEEISSEEEHLNVLSYELIDGGSSYAVTGAVGGFWTEETLIIPNEFAGKPVTFISSSAFEGCVDIKEIILPDSLVAIDAVAFSRCTSLANITIPNSVLSIGGSAFKGCTSLVEINLSDNLCQIGHFAFHGTGYYLNEENWDGGALYIEDYLVAARDCDVNGNPMLGAYIIKQGTKSLAENVFAGCKNLYSIVIPQGVRWFGWGLFEGCENLSRIVFEDVKENFISYFEFEDGSGMMGEAVYLGSGMLATVVECKDGDIRIEEGFIAY